MLLLNDALNHEYNWEISLIRDNVVDTFNSIAGYFSITFVGTTVQKSMSNEFVFLGIQVLRPLVIDALNVSETLEVNVSAS